MVKITSKALRYISKKLTLYAQYGILGSFFMKTKLRKRGVNLNRYSLYDKKWLKNLNIDTVIDIGANVGEFTFIFHELFPSSQIHAFEPIPECFNKLNNKVSGLENVITYKIGLGSQTRVMNLNKSSHDPASSFRVMSEFHKENYPHSAQSEQINVKVQRLDDILDFTNAEKNIFIKMDVQGFEDEVIKGGLVTFSKAKVIIVECSYRKLYNKEPMFHGIYELLTSLGFEFMGCLKQSENKKDETYLQGDCIFVKNS